LLATIKPSQALMIPTSAEKTFQIDDHMGAVASGLLADGRVLIDQARIRAQVHKLTYEEPIDVWNLARGIGDRMQLYTSYAGLRPYGVTLLIGGYDKTGLHLIECDPSGMLYEWFATAIGRGGMLANKILKQKWKKGMSEENAINLAIEVLDKTEKKGEIEIALIKVGEKFKKLSEEELKRFLK
jgi:proteasome alpha subunit